MRWRDALIAALALIDLALSANSESESEQG
jgi:hypothetical protein